MPHLVMLYTPDVEPQLDIGRLCRALADTMLEQRDEAGGPVFPPGGVRVLAFPAAHCAVADGGAAALAAGSSGELGFVYLNLRMAAGRTAAVQQRCGAALAACVRAQAAQLLAERHVGITLQIDESPGQVYDAKLGNLHPLFAR